MNERLSYLFQQLYENKISPEEREELYLLVQDPSHVLDIKELIRKTYDAPALEELPEQRSNEILQAIFQAGSVETAVVKPFTKRNWFRVAAAALIVLALGAWFLADRIGNAGKQKTEQALADIAAGRDGAILTLADGSEVLLDSLQDGIVATQGGATVSIGNGQLQYEGSSGETVYNTMRTPKGRQYQLSLPDGSKVWLNAASSIRYPVAFNGNERKVEVSGEVFFEVTPKAKQPFIVQIDQRAEVDVLGTSFNVNAYQNEPEITTTLIEGVVRVRGEGKDNELLSPGQKAAIGKNIVVSDANIEGITAWKNGSFYFNHMKITEVMRQIERWYDVEVVYENGIPDVQLFGGVKRDLSLESMIRGLKDMGVDLRLESGRKLVVTAQ